MNNSGYRPSELNCLASGGPATISDGDTIPTSKQDTTVDRMARQDTHLGESWGFRIRHLFDNLMR